MENRNRKLHRSLNPIPIDINSSSLAISPDYNLKSNFMLKEVNCKQNSNTNAESQVVPSSIKQFVESSPIRTDQKRKRKKIIDEQYFSINLSEINLELDNNMNEIIFLLGKRKQLMTQKKRKMRDQFDSKLNQARYSLQNHQFNQFPYLRDKEFLRITEFCQNPITAMNILKKILQILPNINDPNLEQKERSQVFWEQNRYLENNIDELLAKLKSNDKNLQRQNIQVQQICKQLDKIEDHLKSFVGSKTSENVQRVQPLFQAKKKKYDILNRKIKTLQYCKDSKIEFIKKIKKVLDELLNIRKRRLQELAQFFGLQNFNQFAQIDFKQEGDFTKSFQQLLKLKEKGLQLKMAERQINSNIEDIQKDQQKLYNELVKKQSDEAKAYHSYNDIIAQRLKCASILNLFSGETEGSNDPKQLTKKFKQCKGVIKIFLQEQASLRQGLIKTNQTSKTFSNLLNTTQNQKQRRYELLTILQTCIRRRGEYQQKKQELRNLAFEESKNSQELSQHEEELEAVLIDGDIDNYKQIGQAIGRCEKEKTRLQLFKEKIEKQMEHMDREVVALANKVKQEYQDILCDIVPSDYQYSLKNGEDVKKLRNHLRKMYKRLGILSHQSN